MDCRISFDAVTGVDIQHAYGQEDTPGSCTLLKLSVENGDGAALRLDGYTCSATSGVMMLLRNAAGLDGKAMREEESLKEIEQQKKAAALRARPHFIAGPAACTCTPYYPTGRRNRKSMELYAAATAHSNCVRLKTCDLVKASIIHKHGYKWKWKLKGGKYGYCLIDRTPLPQPAKSKAEQEAELATKKKEADARKLAREKSIQLARRQLHEHIFCDLTREATKPLVATKTKSARLLDFRFTVVQKAAGENPNRTLRLEVFLQPAFFVSLSLVARSFHPIVPNWDAVCVCILALHLSAFLTAEVMFTSGCPLCLFCRHFQHANSTFSTCFRLHCIVMVMQRTKSTTSTCSDGTKP